MLHPKRFTFNYTFWTGTKIKVLLGPLPYPDPDRLVQLIATIVVPGFQARQ
jgi:hypothetical protein